MKSKATPPAKEESWVEQFEDLWRHWIYLSDIKIGVNFNAFKDGIKSVFRSLRSQAYEEGYNKGFVSCMVADGIKLKKIYKEGRREAVEKLEKMKKTITLKIQKNQSHQSVMLPTGLAKQIVKVAKYMKMTSDEWIISRLQGQLSRFNHKI